MGIPPDCWEQPLNPNYEPPPCSRSECQATRDQLEAMQAEIDQRDRFIAEISKELREIRAIIEARASLDRQGK